MVVWRRVLTALLIGVPVLTVLGLATSKVEPAVWTPGPNPGLSGEFAPNDALAEPIFLMKGEGIGPEELTIGPDQWLYTGLRDGRIVRFSEDGQFAPYADIGSMPLGLAFDAGGNLIVASPGRGLVSVARDGSIEVLVHSVAGEPMRMVNNVAIADDGTIWFTDSSRRFGVEDYIYIFLEGRADGRLLSYMPESGEVTVHLDDLFFANGVAVGPDGEYVLAAETGAGRIRRLWLKGEQAGESDVFAEHLPGTPDNLSFDEDGTLWVALAGLRDPTVEALADGWFIRKLLGALPPGVLTPSGRFAFVVGLDSDGKVIYNLQSAESPFRFVTSALRVGDKLYLGSLGTDGVGVVDLRR